MPTDIKSAAQFRTEVLATRMAGARVALGSEPSHFTLTDTEGFAAEARGEAAPPPPMTTPGEADTADFAASARRSATPPARPRPAKATTRSVHVPRRATRRAP